MTNSDDEIMKLILTLLMTQLFFDVFKILSWFFSPMPRIHTMQMLLFHMSVKEERGSYEKKTVTFDGQFRLCPFAC